MNTNGNSADRIANATQQRFGERIEPEPDAAGLETIATMLEHSTFRHWDERPVDSGLLRLLYAAALSSPSKGDMQQADIIQVVDPAIHESIAALIGGMDWIRKAPVLLIFCGNGRRMQRVAEWRGKSFENDRLDHFFNVTCDAALVLGRFLGAAEASGLGCCPVSAVRDKPDEISEILGLPDGVFPIAGLCAGYPSGAGRVTPRLPLDVTLHTDHYDETRLPQLIDTYDRRRHDLAPYNSQREVERFGWADSYTWTEQMARQCGMPERQDFGAFVRAKRFSLD